MADDVTLPGSGSVIATDDDGTRQHQWVKLEWGPADTFNKVDTASGKPLPIQLRGSDGTDVSKAMGSRERLFSAASTQLVRPANVTPYTANDEISATSPASLSVTVSDTNDDPIAVTEILVSTTDAGFAGKNLRVWVYNGATTAGTDNGAFSSAKANFVGTFSGSLRTASDGAVGRLVPDEGTALLTTPASGAKTLQLRVQTLDAPTPSANSTTFDFNVKGIQGRAA